MTFTRKQKKAVFTKIFKGTTLKLGDVIRFRKKGRVLYQVCWQRGEGFRLRPIMHRCRYRDLDPRDYHRVEIVSKLELAKLLLRNKPGLIKRYVERDETKRARLLRKIIPKPVGLDDIYVK